MIKQNIFIINHNLLYEILEEIKENLSFKVIKYESELDFIKDDQLDVNNSLIISKNSKRLLNTKINNNNLFEFKEFPLSITKLIELINIQLIKIRFNHQSKIIIKGYELNLNSKFIFKDGVLLKLTEKEIEVILYLNKNKKKHHVLDLQINIWGYSSEIETHTVETHIHRLRKKLSNKFNDHDFIISQKDGYFIKSN